jgi:hypothetical protein
VRTLLGVFCLLALITESALVLWSSAGISAPKGERLPTDLETLRTERPEIVFVSNSILLDSTDDKIFTELTGRKTLIIGHRGSACAWWYLALKNVVLSSHTRPFAPTERRPALVVFFFRDYDLTDPGFRVTGLYKTGIDEMSLPKEPVLDTLAYRGTMNPVTYLLTRYCPLYQHRQRMSQQLGSRVRNKVVCLLSDLPGYTDQAIDRVFLEENLDAELLTIRQLAAASRQTAVAGDFPRQLHRSFLPHMIDLAEAQGVRLAVVRMKRRRDTIPNCEPPALREYIQDLAAYLAENQVPFIDFTHEPRLTLDQYGAGDHLMATPAIQRHFTSLLAERLAPVLAAVPKPGADRACTR